MELFAELAQTAMPILAVAFASLISLVILITSACRPSPNQRAIHNAAKTLIANMALWEAFAYAIPEVMAILTSPADSKESTCVQTLLVELELNVEKGSTEWNVFVHPDITVILTSNVTILTSVPPKFAVRMRFVSTHPEALIANVNRDLLEIHS